MDHLTIWELLAPFRQTARFCGMDYLPPFVVHGMLDRPTDEEMRRIASQYTTVLRGVSDGSLPWRNLAEGAYLNSGEGSTHERTRPMTTQESP